MGYTTYFNGSIGIEPPLNEHEVSFLKDLANTRRMARAKGPLFIQQDGNYGQGSADDIVDYNRANGEKKLILSQLRDAGAWVYEDVVDDGINEPDGQPGLWLQWVPSDDGTCLAWDDGEKFYHPAEWMKYLVTKLLAPSARAYIERHKAEDPRLAHFTCDHVCNGQIEADGEDPDDRWMLLVQDNVVKVAEAVITFQNATAV